MDWAAEAAVVDLDLDLDLYHGLLVHLDCFVGVVMVVVVVVVVSGWSSWRHPQPHYRLEREDDVMMDEGPQEVVVVVVVRV